MRFVESLSVLGGILEDERFSGVVRLIPTDPVEADGAVAEVRTVLGVYPYLPVLLVKGTVDDPECEERAAEWLQGRGIRERLLLLPLYWAVRGGQVIAVYKQSGIIVRDILSMFGGKKPVEGVMVWIGRTLGVERGKGVLPKSPPGAGAGSARRRKPPPKDEEGPNGNGARPRDPYHVLGIARGSSQEAVRKAYRLLCSKHHPDKVAHLGATHQEQAHRRIVEINAAYEAIRKGGA